jgi:hypothetical protein
MSGFIRTLTAGVPLLVLFACTSKPAPLPMPETQSKLADKKIYLEYMQTIKKKVAAAWKYPNGVVGTHAVQLYFRLTAEGTLVSVEVVDATDPLAQIGDRGYDSRRALPANARRNSGVSK